MSSVQYRFETHGEKNWGSKFGDKKPKSGPKLGFLFHFLKFSSLVFLDITYNDSLQQCLLCEVKLKKKRFWRPKIGSEIRLFAIFSILVHQFSVKLCRIIAWNNAQLLAEVKSTIKIWVTQIWAKRSKIGTKVRFFAIF